MTIGRWYRLFEAFKKNHNLTVKKLAFADPQKAVSVDSI